MKYYSMQCDFLKESWNVKHHSSQIPTERWELRFQVLSAEFSPCHCFAYISQSAFDTRNLDESGHQSNLLKWEDYVSSE